MVKVIFSLIKNFVFFKELPTPSHIAQVIQPSKIYLQFLALCNFKNKFAKFYLMYLLALKLKTGGIFLSINTYISASYRYSLFTFS